MHKHEPVTQTMKISDVKNRLSRLVNEVYCKETRVVVERQGIPVAAIASADDLESLARLDAQRAERRKVLAAMREPFRGVSPEEIEQETDCMIAEIRTEDREMTDATAKR